MTLTECLKTLVQILREEHLPFAVAGGLAASLYRAQPRLTADVDMIITLDALSPQKAESLLQGMGFNTRLIRQAELEGGPLFAIKQKSTPVVIVAGREPDSMTGVGADLILGTIPWVQTALTRAEMHQVDFGFGSLPVLTLEDVLLAKLFALKSAVHRPKDLDDVLSIFETRPQPDMMYLQAQVDTLDLRIPPQTKRQLPKEIAVLF